MYVVYNINVYIFTYKYIYVVVNDDHREPTRNAGKIGENKVAIQLNGKKPIKRRR